MWAVARVLLPCAALVGAAGGCKKRQHTEPPGPRIKRVRIEGAKAVDKKAVAEHIEMQKSSALRGRYHYVPGLEVSDAERIEQLYAAHGHYDAEVEPIDVSVVNPERKLKKQKAKVSIRIHEGPGTTVASVTWRWAASVSHGHGFDRHAVVEAAGLQRGDRFTIPALHAAAARAALAAQEQGYVFASVVDSAEVDRKTKRARVSFVVEPGERFVVGRIDIVGLRRVPLGLVQREVARAKGKLLTPALLGQIEASAHGMRAFSLVSAKPGTKTGPGELTVVLRVAERKAQELSLGLAFDIDPVQWSQRGGLRYRHGNLFRNLTRFELKALAGWAELPNPFQLQAHGPRAEFSLRLEKRDRHKFLWSAEPGVAVDIWEGLQAWGTSNRLAVSRFLGRIASLGLSYNTFFADFFNLAPGLRGELERLGIGLQDPYVSSNLELQAELFKLDDYALPHRGVRLKTTYVFANRYVGGQFNYHLVSPELRGYFDPHPRVQLAARARVGLIFLYGGTTSAPFDRRLYLGGLSDVRGWPLRHLSPRFDVCNAGGCASIPIGGNTEVLGNLEMRVRLAGALWLAVFGDVGDVRAEIATIRPGGWMYSTGAGIRYVTPIGPLRADVGIRLNDDPRFPEPLRFAVHLSLGEAF